MSHGAGIVTNATKSTTKGALTQAEVWGKIGDIQKGLSGLSSHLDMLDKALRTHAPSTVMGPDVVDIPAIQRDIENSSSLYDAVFNNLDNQTSLRNNAKAAIAQFTSQCVLSEFHRLGSNIEYNISSMSSFSSIQQVMADSTGTMGTLSSYITDLQVHREAKNKDKEFTAVGYMEKENSAVIDRFDKAASSNSIHLTSVEDGKKLKQEISDRRSTLSSGGKLTLESLEANKDKMDELSKYDFLANGNILDAKRQLIAFYSENSVLPKEYKDTTSIPITHIVPPHVEKGKGKELAKIARLYITKFVAEFYTVHRFVDRCLTEFDTVKGTFWEPPKIPYKDVPEIELATYTAQSQKIWDMLDSGKSLDPKICSLITQPCMKGRYGTFKVEGEKGNGVHALWVLMMRYRACDDKHARKLRQVLADSPNLFRNPKHGMQHAVEVCSQVIRECLILGIKVTWDTING